MFYHDFLWLCLHVCSLWCQLSSSCAFFFFGCEVPCCLAWEMASSVCLVLGSLKPTPVTRLTGSFNHLSWCQSDHTPRDGGYPAETCQANHKTCWAKGFLIFCTIFTLIWIVLWLTKKWNLVIIDSNTTKLPMCHCRCSSRSWFSHTFVRLKLLMSRKCGQYKGMSCDGSVNDL